MKKAVVIAITIAVLGAVSIHNATPSQAHLVASKSGATSGSSSSNSAVVAAYKDGTFTGSAQYNPFGTVQIAVVISGGKITDVKFLQMPSDLAHSQEVTAFSEPLLKQTTLSSQSANIDFVSGATTTSTSYQASLQSALDQAATSASSNNSTNNSPANSTPGSTPLYSQPSQAAGGNYYDQ